MSSDAANDRVRTEAAPAALKTETGANVPVPAAAGGVETAAGVETGLDGADGAGPDAPAAGLSERELRRFEALLDYVRRVRGFDYSGYKRASLLRRVQRRMQMAGIEPAEFAGYQDYLEVHPDEFDYLFNTVLINVTGFFRDPAAWGFLSSDVLPRVLQAKGLADPIRAWSAGCASGQEAYTLVMALAERIGINACRERVKVYGTDLDDEALGEARAGSYSMRDVAGVPPDLLAKYFDQAGDRFTFHKELRRCVIFGRHDIIRDAPISRVDVIACRNILMYFNAETQRKIVARLHFALNDHGVLFLGKAEALFSYTHLFAPVDGRRRFFAKVAPAGAGARRERPLLIDSAATAPGGGSGGDGQGADGPGRNAPFPVSLRLHQVIFDTEPVAQIIVDTSGLLALANARARALFRIAPADTGRAIQDLEVSYRPLELRSLLETAYVERRVVEIKGVAWNGPLDGATGGAGAAGRAATAASSLLAASAAVGAASGSARGGNAAAVASGFPNASTYLDVQVVPLVEPSGVLLGASVTFIDVTRFRHLQDELEDSNRELETAYEELQSSNEELETTNEELQSTVEELETTNEELQSTNEELETMNEELQSTNEELQSMNEELRQSSVALNQVNNFFASILTSLKGGVAVVDRDLTVEVWSPRAEDLWGARENEARGKNLLSLDIGLPAAPLLPPIRACLAGDVPAAQITVPATNRRGRAITCEVTVTPLSAAAASFGASAGNDGLPAGVILVMEEIENSSAESASIAAAAAAAADGSSPLPA